MKDFEDIYEISEQEKVSILDRLKKLLIKVEVSVNDKGVASVEHAILLVGIAAAIVLSLAYFGNVVDALFQIAANLTGGVVPK